MSGIVLQLLQSVCLALLLMVQKTVSRKKENPTFCCVMLLAYLSLYPRCIARQLLIRWSVSRRQIHHLEQKPGAV